MLIEPSSFVPSSSVSVGRGHPDGRDSSGCVGGVADRLLVPRVETEVGGCGRGAFTALVACV